MESWIIFNLSQPRDLFGNVPYWSYVFRDALHSFWRYHNLEIFSGRNACHKPVIIARLIFEKMFKFLSTCGD